MLVQHHRHWNTKESTIKKWCCLTEVECFRIVKPVITALYVELIREEENTVKLPELYWIALFQQEQLPLYCKLLDTRLLQEHTGTHTMLTEMLISLFKTPNALCRCVETRDMLIRVVKDLAYADILWLYAYRLANPQDKNVILQVSDRETTDLLLAYLYRQNESMIVIKTVFRVYELRTAYLFECIVSLLLREMRYATAVEAYHFMRETLQVQDPLFYLKRHKHSLSTHYTAFIQCLNT